MENTNKGDTLQTTDSVGVTETLREEMKELECRYCANDCMNEYSMPHANICDDCLSDKLAEEEEEENK